MASWSLGVGKNKVELDFAGESIPLALGVQHALAERLVLSKLRKKFGLDQVSFAATGAAPIALEALQFVLSLGIPVCEGWGMSEISAFGTINRPTRSASAPSVLRPKASRLLWPRTASCSRAARW